MSYIEIPRETAEALSRVDLNAVRERVLKRWMMEIQVGKFYVTSKGDKAECLSTNWRNSFNDSDPGCLFRIVKNGEDHGLLTAKNGCAIRLGQPYITGPWQGSPITVRGWVNVYLADFNYRVFGTNLYSSKTDAEKNAGNDLIATIFVEGTGISKLDELPRKVIP
jgi:hypothetical protein